MSDLDELEAVLEDPRRSAHGCCHGVTPVTPLQSRGEHNPRDFHKLPLELPIPEYDAGLDLHVHLAALGAQAEQMAASVELPVKSFEAQRRRLRETLAVSDAGQEIERLVARLLGGD
ncbi:MAG: hypothetical protein ACYCSF_02815 [Acidimicrobiales bacterium]